MVFVDHLNGYPRLHLLRARDGEMEKIVLMFECPSSDSRFARAVLALLCAPTWMVLGNIYVRTIHSPTVTARIAPTNMTLFTVFTGTPHQYVCGMQWDSPQQAEEKLVLARRTIEDARVVARALRAGATVVAAPHPEVLMTHVAECHACKRTSDVALPKCSRCGHATYCNETCQKAHWKIHKITCRAHAPQP